MRSEASESGSYQRNSSEELQSCNPLQKHRLKAQGGPESKRECQKRKGQDEGPVTVV